MGPRHPEYHSFVLIGNQIEKEVADQTKKNPASLENNDTVISEIK